MLKFLVAIVAKALIASSLQLVWGQTFDGGLWFGGCNGKGGFEISTEVSLWRW